MGEKIYLIEFRINFSLIGQNVSDKNVSFDDESLFISLFNAWMFLYF